jgi:hypothetical protein
VANVYDVNSAIDKPNLLGMVAEGWRLGAQKRQVQEEERRQNELRALTQPAAAGDLDAQDRMLALDPDRAKQAMGVQQLRMSQLKGGMDYLRDAMQSGDPRRIAAAEASVGPFMARVAGKPWQPGALTADPAAFEQAYAQVAMMAQGGAAGVQSTYVDASGNRVAIMRDGTTQILGANDAGMANQTISVVGPDGKPRQMTFNKRTGNYEPASLASGITPAPAGPPQRVAAGAGREADADWMALPEASRMRAAQLEAAGMPFHIVNGRLQEGYSPGSGGGGSAPPGPNLFEGQSPAERAAEEARAKAEVELYTAPEIAARTEGAKIDAQLERAPQQATADANRERLIAEGKSAAERAAAAPGAIATMQTTIDSIDALLADPELGSVVGLGSINPINYIPGSKGRGLIARADQIAGQAFLAAFNQLKGGGAITEREGAAATAAMARLDRAQGEEDYKLALKDLRAAIVPAIERQRAALGGGGSGSQGQYTLGQIIEAGGKRYRVTGLSDPNDPDVEEVP